MSFLEHFSIIGCVTENVLLNQLENAKLCYFSLSRTRTQSTQAQNTNARVGTFAFIAVFNITKPL